MQSERLPRGEIVTRVKRELANGLVSSQSIGKRADLPAPIVAHTLSDLVRRGKIQTTDEARALRRKERNEAISEARGGLWQTIRPYAHLGMWPSEIVDVGAIVHNRAIRRANVKNLLVKKRKKGFVAASHEAPKSSRNRVKGADLLLWLDTAAVLIERGDWDGLPTTREMWLQTMREMTEQGIVVPQLERWEAVLPKWIERAKEKEKQIFQKQYHQERLRAKSQQERDEQLLEELKTARLLWRQTGDRSAFSAVVDKCDAIDATFIDRKRAEIAAIRDGFQVKKDVHQIVEQRKGFATHGDIVGGEREG